MQLQVYCAIKLYMRYFYYLLGLSCLFGCNSNRVVDVDITPYLVDITKPSQFDSLISPRELLTNVEYIKLGSPEKFFLTEAKKILELDSKLFILDKNKKIVVAYDLQGNFIGQVGRKGFGPGEYKSVMDFDVDPKRNSVLIFSSAQQALLEYGSDLTFRKKIRVNIFASQISLLASGNIAFYSYFDEGNSNISIFNFEGEQVQSSMTYPKSDLSPLDYTGFIDGNYYTYPLSSKILFLNEDGRKDSEVFEIKVPNMRKESKKFEHNDFLNAPWIERHILNRFSIGKDAKNFLFYYSFKENGNTGFTLGVKLNNGQNFGHLNLKHGWGSKSDPFGNLFFVGPYNLPTYSISSDRYYIAATNELMEYFYSGDESIVLSETKKIDRKLHSILAKSNASENPIVLRFKLKEEL